MTIPEFYPELAPLLATFFWPPKKGETFESVMVDFAASQPPEVVEAVAGDALMILASDERIREFRSALRELQVDLGVWVPGMTSEHWLRRTADALSQAGSHPNSGSERPITD